VEGREDGETRGEGEKEQEVEAEEEDQEDKNDEAQQKKKDANNNEKAKFSVQRKENIYNMKVRENNAVFPIETNIARDSQRGSKRNSSF
jgi:hypothetical protein